MGSRRPDILGPWLLVALIRIYQRVVSPLLPPHCRFTPTCSEYAVRALEAHGLFRGGLMAIRRLLRCHPWHPGGWDPVPAAEPRDKGRNDGQEDPPSHSAGRRRAAHLPGLVCAPATATSATNGGGFASR